MLKRTRRKRRREKEMTRITTMYDRGSKEETEEDIGKIRVFWGAVKAMREHCYCCPLK